MGTSLAADSLAGPVQDALSTVARFVPKFIVFVVILVAGWFVARLLRTVVNKVLERVGFDRAVERGGVGRALAHAKYDASDLVATLVYYAVLLLALQLAFGVWGPNPVSDLIRGVISWLPRAIVAIVIVVVAAAIANAVRDLIAGALGGLSYGRLLAGLVGVFILGLGVIAALNQIGVATAVTTPVLIAVLATIAGILIVGVGGGLVRPMQQRWERWLDRMESEAPAVSERLRRAADVRTPEPASAGAGAGTGTGSSVSGPSSVGAASSGPAASTEPAVPQPADSPGLRDDPTVVMPIGRPAATQGAPSGATALGAPSGATALGAPSGATAVDAAGPVASAEAPTPPIGQPPVPRSPADAPTAVFPTVGGDEASESPEPGDGGSRR